MRLSYAVHLLGDRPLPERLKLLRESGFDGVDLPASLLADPEARASVADSGLAVGAIYSQVRDPGLLSPTNAERARAIDQFVERATAGAEIGASTIVLVPVFGPPRVRAYDPLVGLDEVETALFLNGLSDLAARIQDLPITVALEPLNPAETHYMTDPVRALEFCDAVGSDRIAPMLDTYHCDLNGQDIPAKLAALGGRLALVHLSDTERRLPGDGSIDFGAVLGALAGLGYSGWMGLECKYDGEDDGLARSVGHLRRLWNEKGAA